MRQPRLERVTATDGVYAALVVVAAALAIVGEQFDPLVTLAVVIALVPWALVALGVRVPLLLFAGLAIAPVVPLVAETGIGAALFLPIAAASRVASRSDQRWVVALVTFVAMALPFVPFVLVEHDVGSVYFAFGGAFSVLVGLLLRRTTRLATELRRADAELAEGAARDERQRIARDVHDLVAHSLTVVVLHVGGARRLIRTDPEAAEAALGEAERVSRESLDAIRGAVGLLRQVGEPQVQSLDLERLVTTYRSAGVLVGLHIDGDVEALPLPVRVTLYRVVQEALANAGRHGARGAEVTVVLEVGRESVLARVSNDYAAAPNRALPAHHFGLLGLREQALSLGGHLTSGPDGSTWVVECRLPLAGAA